MNKFKVQKIEDASSEDVADILFFNSLLFTAYHEKALSATFKKMCLVSDGVLSADDIDLGDECLTQVMNLVSALIQRYPKELEESLLRNFIKHPLHVKQCIGALMSFSGGKEIAKSFASKLSTVTEDAKAETVVNLLKELIVSREKARPDEAAGSGRG